VGVQLPSRCDNGVARGVVIMLGRRRLHGPMRCQFVDDRPAVEAGGRMSMVLSYLVGRVQTGRQVRHRHGLLVQAGQ
jgi:hypothetical protein